MLQFNPSLEPTIGVELELQIIDRQSSDLLNIAPQVLGRVEKGFSKRIKEEFLESMIELNTDICRTVSEVEADLKTSLKHLEDILSSFNATFLSASVHPFAKGGGWFVTDNPRYRQIMDDLQIVGRRFIAQGLHIHIGVDSPERAINVNNTIRIYLPLLLALSTSSPFYEGESTGLYSYRTKLFEALPRAGMPDYLDGWDGFKQLVTLMQKARYIETVKDLWWDVRPHPEFGTVEIRICDMPCRLCDILSLTALVQALVVSIGTVSHHPVTHIEILRMNKWQAARYGLEGLFANPLTGRLYSIREAISDLVKLVEKDAEALDSTHYLIGIERILREGTGAHRQLNLYKETGGDFRTMIKILTEEFYC